jgi:hypothetical protein
MRIHLFTLLEAWLFLLFCLTAHAQTPAEVPGQRQEASQEKDPVAILELGAATSWNIRGGAATFAPTLAAEITPIENWLELEAGVSPFYTGNSSEWDTDLLFKKPWTISRKVEFMLGVGPPMDLPQTKRQNHQLNSRRTSWRFYVLANRQTPLRLVPRTRLRLQLCLQPPAIHWHERRLAHWHP